MDLGLKCLSEGFPLSLRLIKDMHRELLSRGRGDRSNREFRNSQNWIGGTRPGNAVFVPPPPDRLMECLGGLEKFLHSRKTYPVLVRAALAHVQFETIHPFLDGNGRLGRLVKKKRCASLCSTSVCISRRTGTDITNYCNRSAQRGIGRAGSNSFLKVSPKPPSRGSNCSSVTRTLEEDEGKLASLGK